MAESRLNRFYKALLNLYPSSFRMEFGEEMGEVFRQVAEEAEAQGTLALIGVLMGELRDLPAVVVSAHRRARRQAQRSLQAAAAGIQRLSGVELTWQELLATLAVLLIPAVIILVQPSRMAQPGPSTNFWTAVGWTPVLFLAAMLSVGLLRRPTLRSLPILGSATLVSAYLFLFQWVADLTSPALISNFAPGHWQRDTYLMLKAASTGMLWLTLFCLTLLVIALLALYNRFQPLCWRIRHDWSLLSFILHGEAVFVLLLLVEHHRSERPFAITCLLWLTAGAWLYRRNAPGWKRAFTAGAAGLIAMSLAIHEVSSLVAIPGGLPLHWAEAGRILSIPVWILAGLLLPAWLSRRLPAWRDLRQKGI